MIGTDHHDTAMDETRLPRRARALRSRASRSPAASPRAPALLQLSRFAAQDVKVVLAGQGADEPHGGYGRHQAAALLAPLKLVPSAARDARGRDRPRAAPRGGRAPGGPSARRPGRRRAAAAPGRDHGRGRPLRAARRRVRTIRRPSGERLARAREILAGVADRGLLEQALYLDTHMFLPDGILICNDKMSMAAGLELRVPFLDLELMRLRGAHPGRAGASARAGKRLHRRRWSGCSRRRSSNRPKHGFATPYDDWLRASLGQEVERRYAPGSALSRADRPARGRAAGGRAPPRPRRPQGDPLLPARALGVAPRLRRGARRAGATA